MLTRREFLKLSAAAGAGAVLWPRMIGPLAAQPTTPLLNPLTVPQFVNPLPNPLDPSFIFTPANGTHYDVGMYQTQQNLLGPWFDDTTVWGYGNNTNGAQGPTYPGRTFVARKDEPVTVRWTNDLVSAGVPLPHLLPVDTTLHWADPGEALWDRGVPVVTHLHGGHTESDSDGLPEYWFTPGFAYTGPHWAKETYVYDNDQEAATLWYHDHALGITRLNVYAGLAGFYLLRDDVDTGDADNPLGLPAYPYEVPIVIQDRMFTADAQLFYPSDFEPEEPGAPFPGGPSVLPEFFGNVILVNGRAWPFLNVEPRRYRFRLLNGSDSRFYNLWITSGSNGAAAAPDGNGPQIIQIGSDLGLLGAPVPLDQLTIGPGERADVIVDFTGWEGETLVMRNNARSPFPKGDTVNPRLDGRIMAFNVAQPLSGEDTSQVPSTLRGAPFGVGPEDNVRRLALFEGLDEYGRLRPQLGILDPTSLLDGSLLWDEEITENPELGATEVWEIYNGTVDAHPIHLHLVAFEILSRQKFKGDVVEVGEDDPPPPEGTKLRLENVRLVGRPKPPPANEAGPKDTAQMFPGEVTRVRATFDRPGRYVWHCHILSHEDHEMMRPYEVVTPNG